MALLECRQIARFVVGNTIHPAAKQDADPFEGKGADGRVVGRAFGLVAVVASAGGPGAASVLSIPATARLAFPPGPRSASGWC
jgi:hypothetical protein